MATLLPEGKQSFTNSAGAPLIGGKLYTYDAGTSTPRTTYQDAAGTVPNTNPIILDARGEATVFWSGSYKVVLKDASDVTIWTVDNSGGPDVSASTVPATDGSGGSIFTTIQGFITKILSSAGSSIVGFIASGVSAVARNLQDRGRDTVSAFDYMTAAQIADVRSGAASVDVTLALQAAINAVVTGGGGEVFLPTGTYKITSALVMDTGIYTRGVSLRGTGRNTIISQTGAGQDAIKFSTTQFLQNSYIRDMQIITSATAGHVINIVYGCTCCFFDNLDLTQGNPNKAIFYGDWSTFGGGVYDANFRGGSWYLSAASVEAGVRFICNGTIFNENIFENMRCYNANTAQFFKITTVTAGNIWLTGNNWKNINFEVCKGGGFYFDSFKTCKWDTISFWDAGGAYTNHLFDFASGAGYESASNTLINCTRNGDSVGAGINDIRLLFGQDTMLINCYTSASPVYNFNGKRVTVMGALTGTQNNKSGMIWLGSQLGGIQFPGSVNGTPLNYYDEGTSTLTLTTTGTTPTVPVTGSFRWTRVGRKVSVEGVFSNVSLVGSTGNLKITGLQFPCGVSNSVGPVALLGLGVAPAVCLIVSGTTELVVANAVDLSGIPTVAAVGKYVYFSINYTV